MQAQNSLSTLLCQAASGTLLLVTLIVLQVPAVYAKQTKEQEDLASPATPNNPGLDEISKILQEARQLSEQLTTENTKTKDIAYEKGLLRDLLMRTQARVYAAQGDHAAIFNTISGFWKAVGIRDLAITQARNGQVQGALQTAALISEQSSRVWRCPAKNYSVSC